MKGLASALLPDLVFFSRCRRREVCKRYTATFALLHERILFAHLRGGSKNMVPLTEVVSSSSAKFSSLLAPA